MKEKISVFGLGKLGCTMLACFAHKGWDVIGMDTNPETVSKVNNGDSPIYEPGVDSLIKENRDKISATTSSSEAVLNSDISFVIVPTPSKDDGSFSTKFVEVVAAEIGSILREKKSFHHVVITSTVLPGDMEQINLLLERTSGKKCNEGFGLCYNPDFIALGSVVRNFLNPDMILIGESDSKAGEYLHSIHSRLVDNDPAIHRMNFYNAELTKISLNSYCTLKISFANTLAEICEKMPGGDVSVVTNALGADTRVGHKYIKGGLSYGGPCFPRDNRAFAYSADKFGVEAPLAITTDKLNNYQKNTRIPELITQIIKDTQSNKKVAVLGTTYKDNTTLVEESASISVIEKLSKSGVSVNVYDPAGIEEAQIALKDCENINFFDSIESCLKDISICFIATPWGEFKELDEPQFEKLMKTPATIIDGWNIYSSFKDNDLSLITIGKNFDKI